MNMKSVMGGPGLAMVAYLGLATLGAAAGTARGQDQPAGGAEATLVDRSGAEVDALIRGFGGDKAVTRPGREAIMGFSSPTTIKEIIVKGGQMVKKGELLIRGDDTEQVAIYKFTKLQADTDLPVQKAQKTRELAEIEWKKYEEVTAGGAGSQQEYERAKLTFESASIDLDTAKMQQEQQKSALERAESLVERFRIRAPFDGQVDIVLYDEGHNVNEQDKIIKVVDINTLWMDVPVSTPQTVRLGTKPGDPAWILMQVPGGVRILNGKVIEVAPTADSASRTRRVRVEIDNPEGSGRVIAGEPAWVRLTEPTQEWSAKLSQR